MLPGRACLIGLRHRAIARWTNIAPGTAEAVKWVALLLMIGGHTNAILFDRQWAWPNELGRAAFPAFALAFGYAIARVSEDRRKAIYPRVMVRLLVVGAIAAPLKMVGFSQHEVLPLNILFTFAAGFAVIWCLQRGGFYSAIAAWVVFIVAGASVEFMWPGVLLVVAMWASFQRPGVVSQLFVLTCVMALWPVNGNPYALLIYPLCFVLFSLNVEVPRWRRLFYVAYPLHLVILILLRYALRQQ